VTEPAANVGQAAPADSTGTTATAPNGSQGQSVTQGQTTVSGSAQGSDESPFDWKSIEHSPELVKLAKQLQGSYTKKSQALKADQAKLDQYNQFMRDPIGSAQQVLSTLGYNVVQRDPNQANGKEGFAPKTWDDVMAEAEKRVFNKMKPVFHELDQVKQQSLEARLDHEYPDWRTYEEPMVELLKQHPTLARDYNTLYRMAVPAEVLEARAHKAALEKIRGAGENAQVSGQSATTRQASQKPTGKLTLNQAYEHAKAQLAQGR
jgi:hypothetical protein